MTTLRIRTQYVSVSPTLDRHYPDSPQEFEPHPPTIYQNGGYYSVAELRKELQRRWKGRTGATLTDIPGGLRLDLHGDVAYGYKMIQEVTQA